MLGPAMLTGAAVAGAFAVKLGVDGVKAAIAEEAELKKLVERHVHETGSRFAARLLNDWAEAREHFWHIVPKEYAKYLPRPMAEVGTGRDPCVRPKPSRLNATSAKSVRQASALGRTSAAAGFRLRSSAR
jgi:hypothetical protein